MARYCQISEEKLGERLFLSLSVSLFLILLDTRTLFDTECFGMDQQNQNLRFEWSVQNYEINFVFMKIDIVWIIFTNAFSLGSYRRLTISIHRPIRQVESLLSATFKIKVVILKKENAFRIKLRS